MRSVTWVSGLAPRALAMHVAVAAANYVCYHEAIFIELAAKFHTTLVRRLFDAGVSCASRRDTDLVFGEALGLIADE
jgi:hypothetical protein